MVTSYAMEKNSLGTMRWYELVMGGDVNSFSRKIHVPNKYLIDHGITFHFNFKMRNPVYTQST